MTAQGSVGAFPVAGIIESEIIGPAISLWINGVNLTGYLWTGAAGTPIVNVSEVVNGTSVCDFALVEEDAPTGTALDLVEGYEIIIEHQTRRLFGGSIHEIRADNPGASDVIFHRITCKDYSAELEKKLVANSYEDTGDPVTQTVGDIITSIFNDFLSDSGLILGDIDDGPLLRKINFSYVKAIQALADLSGLTSGTYVWHVDFFKVLTFKERTSIPAPYSIDDTQVEIQSLETSRGLSNYRNRQVVRGGKAESEGRLELFEGDGKLKTFTLSLPVASKPVIEVNTVAVNPSAIGIKGIDDDDATKTWLYQRESETVSAKVAPGAGDDIEITYTGLFPIIVIRGDSGEQTTRASNEIGDGIYEALDVDEELDLPTTRQKADALLEKHARVPSVISLTTDRQADIRPGQLMTVNLTKLGISNDYLIESIDTSLVGDAPRSVIQMNDGRELLEWLEFYRKIQREPFLVRENDKIIVGSAETENLLLTDSLLVETSDERIAYTADEYTAFLVGSPIGHFLENGEADGPAILTLDIV